MRRRSLSQPSRALDRSTEGDGTVHQTVHTSTSVPIYAALVERWASAGRAVPGRYDREWAELVSCPAWPDRVRAAARPAARPSAD
ncbi:hypothetical protein AB0B12_16110 [Streptomyces sp. NPDC044780]|uniref:hypothetical protein n=1 Tax=unclassified Streptomyces TaxID=2593676 RepID=UPI0022A88A47|nr:hypothetical protein [Streptomyces sp. S465]WAP54202.1 hypothetical protein N6H00_04025 [Streptomyces sp. S465]